MICQEFDEAFKSVQVILAPTIFSPAPTIDDCNRGYIEVDGKRINLQDRAGNFLTRYTIPFNVTGLPDMSICCGFSSRRFADRHADRRAAVSRRRRLSSGGGV